MARTAGGKPEPFNPFTIVETEDRRISRILGYARLALLVLVVGVGGALTFTQISGAVIASGKVAVQSNSKSIQHLEGGIVSSLAVQEGQQVRKNDLLLTLDPTKLKDTMKGIASQAEAKKEQLELMKSELADLRQLEARQLVRRSQIMRAKRDIAQLEGDYGRLKSEMSRISSDRKRLQIRAPLDGRVHGLKVHTVGGVVAPGQEILQIVPSNATLILEARVVPQDIDQVAQGQAVSIRLSSFNQRATPELNGTVSNVSADIVADETGRNYFYMVQVALNKNEKARLGDKTLLPGMPAEVFIQTDQRSIMSYLMRPLWDQLERAMRED